MTTMKSVTIRPTSAQAKRPPEVKLAPCTVVKAAEKPPNITQFTRAMAPTDSTPAAMKPL